MLRFPARLAAALPRASSSKVGKHTRLPSGTTSLRNPKRSSPVTANVASAGATPTSVATSTAGSRASASAASAASTTSYPTRSREGGAGLSAPSKEKNNAGRLHFDASKAGLQLVDKAHVERVIQEASKDTPFYLKEQRREEARREKADAVLKKAAQYDKLTPAQKQAIKVKVDYLESELEEERDLHRRFIHVDMDMFYAAVEEKKNPALRDVPFGVGSYNMLSTTNYIARQYGVRSGMPGFIGRKLCPDLLIVPTDFASYRREAGVVHSIAARYDPQFMNLGLDELTMDVTHHLQSCPWKTASQIASEFREEVFKKTHLTCSGGIAPTSALAKIASNVNKPNGQHEIVLDTRADTLEYVKSVPLRKIPGIGYAQELTLNALGIKTCGDLLRKKCLLFYLFKEKTFMNYLSIGLGLMEAHSHKPHETRQSIGKEKSFSDPLPSQDAFVRLFRKLLEPCHAQCVKEHLVAHQMRLVLKYHTYDFEQYSITLPRPTNDLKVWLDASRKLLAPHLSNYANYRLVGVRMQKLTPESSVVTACGFSLPPASADKPRSADTARSAKAYSLTEGSQRGSHASAHGNRDQPRLPSNREEDPVHGASDRQHSSSSLPRHSSARSIKEAPIAAKQLKHRYKTGPSPALRSKRLANKKAHGSR